VLRDDYQPCLEGVQVKTVELLIGQDRKNDRREQEELGEGEARHFGGDSRGLVRRRPVPESLCQKDSNRKPPTTRKPQGYWQELSARE